MYLFFIDESGKPDDKLFSVGGIIVRAEDWPVLDQRWASTCQAHGWPLDKEIKWHAVVKGLVPPALADDVFAALADSPILCMVLVLKPLAARQRRPDLFGTPEDTYNQALMWLAERYERFLARQNAYGVMVLDSRREDVDDRVRRFFEGIRRDGTPYLQLDHIVDAVLLGPSHYSTGLQCADLVAASTRAAQRALGDASRWHKQLLPRFARHPDTGEVAGVGIVTYPKTIKPEEPPPTKLFSPL